MIRAILTASILLGLGAGTAMAQNVTWKSGVGSGDANGFAAWRGRPLGLATGWAPWDNWANMLNYMKGGNPGNLKSRSTNVSIGLGLFPQSGGSLADCAAGAYAGNHRDIGQALAAKIADAEVRLGWEANNSSYPWTAVGKPADQWKACFVNAATAIKAGGPSLRIAWHMAKKGKINVYTIYPDQDDALITNIGVSHFDDAEARFGFETADGSPSGSPVGLKAWADLACAKKHKQLEMAEWGDGRRGDNPAYIERMYRFFSEAGSCLAHEGYLNGREHQLYPTTNLPNSARAYQRLF